MSETPTARSARPSVMQIVITALLVVVFAVKAVYWWLAVSAGTMVIADMSGWRWVSVGFYHLAVVAGVAGIVEMLRVRARSRGAEPIAPPDRGGRVV